MMGYRLCACLHVACTCTPKNIIDQAGRPIFTFAENFVKICLHLAEILRGNEKCSYLAFRLHCAIGRTNGQTTPKFI